MTDKPVHSDEQSDRLLNGGEVSLVSDGPAVTRSRRVLLVDDSVEARESLGMLLALLGHQVRVVDDVAGFLEAIGGWQPEVVLFDLRLPCLSGKEAVRLLRQEPGTASARLIGMTGWQEDRREALADGFDAALLRPFDLDELQRLLGQESPGPARPVE